MGHKKIWCHMVYDAKQDGHYKSQLVANNHLTDPNTESDFLDKCHYKASG
jgi:hypothetical protein